MDYLLVLAQANDAGEAVGGLIIIAICVGLCIAMNQPKEKVTDYDFKGRKTERYR